MVVLLPAPFGPRNPVTTPGRILKPRSLTAQAAPYRLVRPLTTIITRYFLIGMVTTAVTLRRRRGR
jgi:hypothetical protein